MKKNIIANLFGRFFGILSNFLFIPLYIKYLGFESYSIISFTILIAGIMAVLDAGLTATLSREFAKTDNSFQDKLRIYQTLETSYIIVTIVVISLIFLFSSFISNHWINSNLFSQEKISLFLKIIAFDIGFQLLMKFYMGGMLGLEKQVEANMYQVFWGLLRNGFVVLIIYFYPSLLTFFIWQSAITILFAVLFRFSLIKQLGIKNTFGISLKIEKEVFKKIYAFAGGMMLISIVAAINTQMDKIAISKLLSIENLGYYTLAVSLSQGILVLISPISVAVLPRFTALYSAGVDTEIKRLYKIIGTFVSIVVFSVLALLMVFPQKLIWIWTGDKNLAEHIKYLLPIIAFSMSMLALATLPYQIAIANGYTKLNNILGIASILITLPGYWMATKMYDALGAAVVFCAVQTITTLLYIYFINNKFLKVRIFSDLYYRQLVLPLVISIVIVFLLSRIPVSFMENRIFALLWIGFGLLVTLTVNALILIPKSELKSLANIKKLIVKN